MNVPLLDLKKQLAPLRDQIIAAVTEVIDSTGYILGPKVEELEDQVARYCRTAQAIGVSSGTDALLAALMGVGVGPGDLVLTTPYTFVATIGSILRLGAQPIFADIDPVSFNIAPDRVAEVLADASLAGRIKALLPVHLYGQCADMARLLPLAAQYGIPLIEDAAQAIGAACPLAEGGSPVWRKAGAMGVAGCFSFFPSKNLGGIGDGGMITLSDEQLAERIRILRVHGGSPKYHHPVVGGNFRLDPIQAVALSVKLPHLPAWHQARRRNAAHYAQLFQEAGLVESGAVQLPAAVYAEAARAAQDEPDYHIYNQYVLRVSERDRLREFLTGRHIGCEIYYPVPMHKQGCVKEFGMNELSFPESERAARETLALPVYPELTREMQQFVVEQIQQFYKTR